MSMRLSFLPVPYALGCWLIVTVLSVNSIPAMQREYFLPRPSTEKHVVILAGAAAEEKQSRRFRDWSMRLAEVLTTRYGYDQDHIRLLIGHGDPTETKITGPCDKETIAEAVHDLKTTARPGDQILFILIGHGTSNEAGAKFNIVGPDITGEAFSQLLNELSDKDIIVVNTTSASHPFCSALSAPGRVIISATRSHAEKYDTIFARQLIEAVEGHRADRDKNGRLSMWEAFQYAKTTVGKWYTDQNRIPSEHPTLDDNGDSMLSVNPDPSKNDGRLAQIAYIDTIQRSTPITGTGSPVAYELIRRMHELERAVFLLRNRKKEVPEEDYKLQMETLLIDLARTTRDFNILHK